MLMAKELRGVMRQLANTEERERERRETTVVQVGQKSDRWLPAPAYL